MYKRIYVPVDDSESSNLALTEACKLAKVLGSQIQLAHIVDLTQFGWGGTEFLDTPELQKAAKESGRQVLALAEQKVRDANLIPGCTILECWGDKLATLLHENATEWGADLIVMGTHGWTGLVHLIMGSVAEGVLKLSDVPVLLVRNPNN